MSEGLSKKLQRLDDFLRGLQHDDETMLLSELDGFLAGVIVCPDLILPSEWMPIIWGESGPVFDDEQEAKHITGLIMGHYNDIIRQLGRGTYCPVYDVDVDDTFIWELWMAGFGKALSLCPDSWLGLGEEDEDIQRALFVLARLTELSTRPVNEIEPLEIDEALEKSAPDVIPALVDILHQARMAKASANAPQPSANIVKVGRNDPCPCGSGKKFKRCCLN